MEAAIVADKQADVMAVLVTLILMHTYRYNIYIYILTPLKAYDNNAGTGRQHRPARATNATAGYNNTGENAE